MGRQNVSAAGIGGGEGRSSGAAVSSGAHVQGQQSNPILSLFLNIYISNYILSTHTEEQWQQQRAPRRPATAYRLAVLASAVNEKARLP